MARHVAPVAALLVLLLLLAAWGGTPADRPPTPAPVALPATGVAPATTLPSSPATTQAPAPTSILPTPTLRVQPSPTPEALPTPTLEPIDEPALAEEHSPAAGAVTGRIGDPDGSPTAGLNLFFENMANEAVTVVPLEPGTITYTTILSPGIYTAYTWAPDFGDKGAFSNCQPGEACSDRTLLPITVTAGLTVSEIDITDWFRPEGEPLALAGILVDGTGADPPAWCSRRHPGRANRRRRPWRRGLDPGRCPGLRSARFDPAARFFQYPRSQHQAGILPLKLGAGRGDHRT